MDRCRLWDEDLKAEIVAEAFLIALAPVELDALSRARKAQQQIDAALRTGAERQLERKR